MQEKKQNKRYATLNLLSSDGIYSVCVEFAGHCKWCCDEALTVV